MGTQQFIEDFNLFIKQCYRIVWSVEKIKVQNPKVAKTKNRRIMLLSKCAVSDKNIKIYQAARN